MTLLEPPRHQTEAAQPQAMGLWLPDGAPAPLPEVREQIRAMLAGASPTQTDAILLACTELVANAYEHGAAPVSFRLSAVSPHVVRIEVSDGSPDLPVERRPVADEPRGRGILLVSRLSRQWGVHVDGPGKTVWAEIPTL